MQSAEITQLLDEIRRGNTEAQSQLASVVYDELHRLAAAYICRERPNHSLQATVLVHDAFIRLVNQSDQNWQNRAHFFAAAARTMRRMLIDYARRHRAEKRGGENARVPFDEMVAVCNDNCEEWIAVDIALDRLARRDERLARVVELKFFTGLTDEEVAEALDISSRTVTRDWTVARAWLQAELSGMPAND